MSDKTGGPAFPVHKEHDSIYEGMTLRDYFAAKAMAAMIFSPDEAFSNDSATECARKAYCYADDMLNEREK